MYTLKNQILTTSNLIVTINFLNQKIKMHNPKTLMKNHSIEHLAPVSRSPTLKKDLKPPATSTNKSLTPFHKVPSNKQSLFRKELAKIVGNKENRDLTPKGIQTDRSVNMSERVNSSTTLPTARMKANPSLQLHLPDTQLETKREYTMIHHERKSKTLLSQSKAFEDHTEDNSILRNDSSETGIVFPQSSFSTAAISNAALENLFSELSTLKQTIGTMKGQITFLLAERENVLIRGVFVV